MARINGSVSSNSDAYEFYIIWEESDVNISNNTSKVTATSYIYCKSHTAYNYNTYNHTITIDGQTYTTVVEGISLSPGVVKQLASASKVITHNTDGSKSINISASSPNLPAGGGYGPSSGSASGTASLTTIPRASSVACADGNIGSSTIISINRASSNFTHTLTYNFNGLTGTIGTKTVYTSIAWTIPTSFFAKISNSKNGQGTITCQTYNGNTLIGSSTCTFNAFVINSNPTVSATVQDVNSATTALTGNANKIVKYFSNAKVVTTATPKNSATISSVKVTCANKSATGANITINNAESNVFDITVTDSRGFITSTSVTKTLVNYIKCAITSIKLERLSTTSNTVKATINGNFFNAGFGTKTNTLTLKWRNRIKGGTWNSYSNLSATKSGNTFSYSGNLGTNFDFQEEYEFEVVVEDLLMSDIRTMNVTRGIPIIDIGKNDVKVNGKVYGKCVYDENGHTINTYYLKNFNRSMASANTNLDNPGINGFFEVRNTELSYTGQKPTYGYYGFLNFKTPDNIAMLQIAGTNGNLYYRGKQSANVTMSNTNWVKIRDSDSWGKVLYDNSSGNNGTITLGKSAADFDYLEIYFFDTNYTMYKCTKINNPNGKKALLDAAFTFGTESSVRIAASRQVSISGTSISTVGEYGVWSSWSGITGANRISIVKVIGYK